MPRKPRVAKGGVVYHVMNRGNGGMPLFGQDSDYAAFEQVVFEAHQRLPVRILAYALMPNHWHFVLWPTADGDLSEFMRWLTVTHATRWAGYRRVHGMGHLCGARFKSFPVESSGYLVAVCRYVERNALRANLVARAEEWRWSSIGQRHGQVPAVIPLSPWPIPIRDDWLEFVNEPQTQSELAEIRGCATRAVPYGSPSWCIRTARELLIPYPPRPPGRPVKANAGPKTGSGPVIATVSG
jgi:putative transposase